MARNQEGADTGSVIVSVHEMTEDRRMVHQGEAEAATPNPNFSHGKRATVTRPVGSSQEAPSQQHAAPEVCQLHQHLLQCHATI